jgi:hypothetical protein
MSHRALFATLNLLRVYLAAAHGSVVRPAPRNSVDSDVAPWNGAVPMLPSHRAAGVDEHWCPVPVSTAKVTPAGRLSGQNGQACFFFNAGCSIGCPTCDGTTRGPVPNVPCDPTKPDQPCARKAPVCSKPTIQPTLPREARTVNTDKPDGAKDDYYQYSPWRAPGSAGVVDPCGVAGGRHGPGTWNEFGIDYINTTHTKAGGPPSPIELGPRHALAVPAQLAWPPPLVCQPAAPPSRVVTRASSTRRAT